MECSICGKEIEKSKFYNAVLCSDECFKKNFWNEKVDYMDDERVVRIDGYHYFIEPENDTGAFRGYGGSFFKIKFFDGRIIETTNLWSQGKIPQEYRGILYDNAEFISPFEENGEERILFRAQIEETIQVQDILLFDGLQEQHNLGYCGN